MDYIQNTLSPYLEYLPYFCIAALSTFILTPIVGYLARKYQVIDLPAKFRKRTDKTISTRVKKYIVPRGGGLAIILPLLFISILTQTAELKIVAILVGIIILTISGLLDDKYQLSFKYQGLAQVLAALIVVAAGISIDRIQSPFDTSINLRMLVLPFTFGSSQYSLVLPADLITIVWILMMINAINWIFGTDGLGEGISAIAFTTILFISVKLGNPLTAFMAAIAAGGILGFLPFNLPPAKIESGTTGTSVYGFLIAVLSILGGIKVPTAVIVLIIPIIDMIWVMVGRINRKGISKLSEVFKVTTTGDDTHLHHRLLKLGFSQVQVAIIEWIAVGVCGIIAFAAGNLPKVTIISIIAVIVLLLFLGVSLLLKNNVKLVKKKEGDNGPKEPSGEGETPESRYAY